MNKLIALCAFAFVPLAACDGSVSVTAAPPPQDTAAAASPLQARYHVDGEAIALNAGRAEQPAAPGSATHVLTQVWPDSLVYADLDGDGDEDAALVLVQQSGGSGVFSYLVAAVRGAHGFVGSDAVLLGDRIAEPAITVSGGLISVQFKDTPELAAFSDPASRPQTIRAQLDGLKLKELVPVEP